MVVVAAIGIEGRMDEAAKKAVLRLFTYGLHVITCCHGERSNAFTANWLTQVSFDPPLVALSVENDAASLPLIQAGGAFAVCVPASGSRELAGRLGRSIRRAPGKLEGLRWLQDGGSGGVPADPPILADCLGYLRCQVVGETPAGDSTLLVARIVDAGLLAEGEPLTMRETGFRHAG